jgi:M3 family oligoendopeptidase
MQRTDYGAQDVQRFRGEVLAEVVPLAEELRARQATELGLAEGELMYWDEAVHSAAGNAQLIGEGTDWLIETAGEMFRRMGPRFDDWWRMMVGRGLIDLPARSGKAPGAFVTDLSLYGVPFLFSNAAGVKADVKTLAHESGHAFQVYQARHHELIDSWWPTAEAAEIHSMSLEYLTWPHMALFFGDDAEAYRKQHLTESLLFLPYGVAIDHFQHTIYETPSLSAVERKKVWSDLERTYLPWRRYGDLPLAGEGGLWQRQIHVYNYPFYYIDYTLAQTCALQLWLSSIEDHDRALETYIALCERGGSLPFTKLVQSAGLVSPFEPGCLAEVVSQARAVLD